MFSRRRAETYPAEVEVDEGGVPGDAELLRDAAVLGAVDLGDVDLPLQLRRQLLPHGGDRLAVAAPRGVELDQPRARRGARRDLQVFGGAGVGGGRVCSVCQWSEEDVRGRRIRVKLWCVCVCVWTVYGVWSGHGVGA